MILRGLHEYTKSADGVKVLQGSAHAVSIFRRAFVTDLSLTVQDGLLQIYGFLAMILIIK